MAHLGESWRHTVRLHGARGLQFHQASLERLFFLNLSLNQWSNLFYERLGLNQFHSLFRLSLCNCGSGIRITSSATRSASCSYLSQGWPILSFAFKALDFINLDTA
jgi:hypothetical protein